jgi:GR25 family glycosyltransferase involved in LPS biosynthesis
MGKWCKTAIPLAPDAQKECIFFHSLFALVLENTHQLNYVTEKMWQALKVGAVPIVAGDPMLYRHVLPSPDAAIFLEDFSDYAAAASYIRNLMRSAKAWEKHVQWKNRVFSDNFMFLLHHSFATLACDLCDKYSVGETDPRHAFLQNMDPCVLDLLSQHNIPDISTGDSALGFDAVFVVHYTPLVQRRQDILNTVKNQFGIEPVFVEAFDREALTAEHLACIGDRDAQRAFINRNTTQGEDSLSLKHLAVYFYMVQHSLQNVLILEDDATFLQSDWKSPQSLWQHILKVLPADYDMLFLSGCCELHNIGTQISEHLYLAQSSRVSSMYLISQKGARNMLRSLPLVAPIDFQMNYAAGWKDQWLEKMPRFHGPRTIDIKLYHTEPYMSEQSNKYRSALAGELGLGLKNRGAGV